jgi:hypothetical protein
MTTRTVLAVTFVGFGIVIIVLCRVATINCTEGQALISMWPYWIAAVVSCLFGVWLAS